MNDAAPLIPRPIPPRVIKFFGEWVSSTATLFIDPTNALRSYNTNPQIVASVHRDIAFSGSCLFLSSLIYLIVLLRTPNISWATYSSQVSVTAILIMAFWVIYAIIIAAALKALGGIVDQRINVSFVVRTLATFYLVATIVATIAFLSSGDQRVVFDVTTVVLRIVLPLFFMPIVFWKPNGLRGRKVGLLYLTIFFLAVANAAIDLLMVFPAVRSLAHVTAPESGPVPQALPMPLPGPPQVPPPVARRQPLPLPKL
jgi:hypothetical protein